MDESYQGAGHLSDTKSAKIDKHPNRWKDLLSEPKALPWLTAALPPILSLSLTIQKLDFVCPDETSTKFTAAGRIAASTNVVVAKLLAAVVLWFVV